MGTETRSSFWDRKPRTGAVLFAVVVSAVGLFLAITVGERPHMRGAWSLVTEYRRGSYEKGTPWGEDPVRVVIRVRVHDEEYAGVVGAQVALVTHANRVVSRGFTGGPEGHIHLPVPERFSKSLFEGNMRVQAFQPGRLPASAEIPLPKEGLTRLQIPIENVRTVTVRVKNDDGGLVRKRGGVTATAAGSVPTPGAAPWPLQDGIAVIAGLPKERPVTLEATVSGHAPQSTIAQPGTPTVTLPIGIELARLNVVIHDVTGKAQANRRLRVRIRDGVERAITTVKTDHQGALRVGLLPGGKRSVIVRDGARRTGASLGKDALTPGEKWRPSTLVLEPYPTLVEGTVTIDGKPAASALVTVRPWSRGGGAETATTDDQGRFKISGLDTGEPVLVTAFKGGLVGRSDAIAAGARDVQIAAQQPGRIAGTLKIDGSPLPGRVLVGVVPPGVRDRGAALQATRVSRDGTFVLESVPPGTYDLVAWTETSEPRVIPDLLVTAGAVVNDSRLDAFGL